MVVACLFAGAGAWGASVSVANSDLVYASELFGTGHAAVNYPEGKTPQVQLTIPGNVTNGDNPFTEATETDFNSTGGTTHMGEAEVTFTLIGGTFDANISSIMWDVDLAADGDDNDEGDDGTGDDDTDPATGNRMNDYVTAPGTVVSIMSGGRKGDNSMTVKIMAATADGTAGTTRNVAAYQRIAFDLPPLTGVALAGANSQNDKTSDDFKYVWLNATSRIVGGAFTDGPLVPAVVPNFYATLVMRSRDAVTLEVSDPNAKTIAIDDDADKGLTAFMSVKEKNKGGYVELATVTVMTIHEMTAAKAAVPEKLMYRIKANEDTDSNPGDADEDAATDTDDVVYSPAMGATPAVPWTLYGLDGQVVDAGLRGTLTMKAEGTRGLFNEDDMLFIDYDKNGKMGAGEGIAIDGMMAMGEALSIDADKSESFSGGTGAFKVFYMPGGKGAINHGSMIKLTAMVNYSDPTAIDETPRGSATTLNFDGVGNPVMAYAIPHSTNGTGDKANVRVRCEQAAPGADACRVFAECWDDMGNRGFGEGPMIAENNVMVANSAAVEMITGLEPMSRISCRVLSRGMVTVQQLTRDGNSGTLVNNTYVGE